jgi:hypothetical protein
VSLARTRPFQPRFDRARCLLILALFFLSVMTVAQAKLFVPDSDLWATWNASDESATRTIDHGDWQQLLGAYLVTENTGGINRFDYASVTDGDRTRLAGYIEQLAAIDPRDYSRAEQRAYWINLYNVLTVEVVLQNYPVESIRDIDGGFFASGPWQQPLVTVAGLPLTLNDIEHRILRPIWRDPRTHYAVNCASFGCPNLAAEAYTAANLERLLDEGARAYINHPRGVSLEDNRLTLSSIYDWFDVDFGKSDAAVIQHLSQYAELELARRLNAYDGRIRYAYDWRLNGP